MGATNRPQELDEAARRRLVKRIYVTLPEKQTREQIISNLLRNINHNITAKQLSSLADATESYHNPSPPFIYSLFAKLSLIRGDTLGLT